MADFVGGLSGLLDRPVIDNTGLQGQFDIELEMVPDPVMPMFQGTFFRDTAGEPGSQQFLGPSISSA